MLTASQLTSPLVLRALQGHLLRADSTIPCILYTLSRLFGIIFSFNPGPRQYTSACSRYIIEASDEGGTSIQIWTKLKEPYVEYSDPDVQPATQCVDPAQAIDSSFCGPQEIKESIVVAFNANFVKVFQSMPVAWYRSLDADTPLQLSFIGDNPKVTLSKLYSNDDSFRETSARMKTEWDLDLPHITSNLIDSHGIDDMFSIDRFIPRSLFERLKRSCGWRIAVVVAMQPLPVIAWSGPSTFGPSSGRWLW